MAEGRRGHRFRARLDSVGVNRCVDVPEGVSRALGGATRIPVAGEVGGRPLRTTLVPRGGGRHRLFVHSRIWRELGADRGSLVDVVLRPDDRAEEVEVPEEVAAALPRGSEAREAFEDLPPASRRQFVRFILEAKGAETRRRRIREGVRRIVQRLRKRSRG
jgi:hypothetical protein